MDPPERVWAFKFDILAHDFRPIQNPSYARNVRSTIAVLYTRQVYFFVKTFKNVTKTGAKSGSLERLYYFLIQFYEGGFSKPFKACKIKGSKTQKNFDVSTPKYPFDKK